ncbi:flagellar biosynthesis anti-sigma factor FlgM [Rufibacter radiotolerans]|uniref:Flagellar biosynthesis anti-sigma factor FlgM n=1 Tax=Rufibacter radiotolerans TaxID=1379910 RepID=A0A0H4VPB1_9BACT|nr:neutral zinc metallopeptidase [Rufibacter radiotolerans]AKQ45772.1 flagellar biosynthesis anti-sigma factor FlgM [Rufibacter radiotolerans]
MKWQGRRKSSNVEDVRGQSGGGLGGGRGISPLLLLPLIRLLFSKVGLVIVAILALVFFLTGTNPLTLLQQFVGGEPQYAQTSTAQQSPEEQALAEQTATVLADTEDVWNKLIQGYREPTLVMFTDQINSACGTASSASGPFYCPGDEKLYIDLSFFEEMDNKLGAEGDFAQAYVIGHEVGHHVQKLTGTMDKVNAMRGQLSEAEFNKLMVRVELQADFYAGVWANHTQRATGFMEPGDLEEALNAASAIGDDRLQKQSTGRVVPDSFTHGTSAQRVRWFKKGFETGDVSQGDTFNAAVL